MRIFLTIIVIVTIHVTTKAQQDPMFSQNMYNHMTINPGFAGARGSWVVAGVYRNQWQKMDNSPETYAVNIDLPLRIKHTKSGIGFNLMSDKLGMLTHMHLMINYSYKYKLNWGVISMGIKAGLINSTVNGEFYIPDMDGSVPPGDDPALGTSNLNTSKNRFDLGAGAFLSAHSFYAGISIAHLVKSQMQIGETGRFFWNKHLYVTGGYTIKLSPSVNVQPSLFYATDFISHQYSLNSNVIFRNTYWGGLSYRGGGGLTFMGGIELKEGLNIGYSFDWNTSGIGQYLGGTHEVTLSYAFGINIGKKEKIYKSIRFL